MKLLALFVAAAVAEEAPRGTAKNEEPCNSTTAGTGCVEGHRCASMGGAMGDMVG